MKKITFWLLISSVIRCVFGGIAGVLFTVWVCNEIQNTGLSVKSAGECIVGAVVTAALTSATRIEWLRHHAVAVVWVSGMVFIIDALLVLTGNVWIIISMGIFATTVVAIIHQTTTGDLINNIYEGTDRTVLKIEELECLLLITSAQRNILVQTVTQTVFGVGLTLIVSIIFTIFRMVNKGKINKDVRYTTCSYAGSVFYFFVV